MAENKTWRVRFGGLEERDTGRKEEELDRKIRIMKKEKNRGINQEIQLQNLAPTKRRKLTMTKYKTVKQMLQQWKKEEREARKEEDKNILGVPKKTYPQIQNKKCFSPSVTVWECKNLYLVKVIELRVIHQFR